LFRVRRGTSFGDLKMTDLNPYAPESTGLMELVVQNAFHDDAASDIGEFSQSLIPLCRNIRRCRLMLRSNEFDCLEFDGHLCLTSELWAQYPGLIIALNERCIESGVYSVGRCNYTRWANALQHLHGQRSRGSTGQYIGCLMMG